MSKRKHAYLFVTIFSITAFISPAVTAESQNVSFIVSEPKSRTEVIESGEHEYMVVLGGTADMDNTTTNGYSSYDIAFQPNVSLTIENIGGTPVVDPWIVINDRRDWRTIDTIVGEATRGAESDMEKLMLIYEFARGNRYHDYPQFQGDELHDPVKHFNCYAAGFCDDIGRVTCALAYRAGFTKDRHGGDPLIRSMHGHVMSEIALDGRYRFIDTDENAFYLDPDNEGPVSGDDIVRDSDLCTRDYTYGPLFRGWGTGEKAASLLGRDDTKSSSITLGHEMHMTLRPGEKLTLRWDNIGKAPGERTLKHFGNSFLDYEPALNEACIALAHGSKDIASENGSLAGTGANAWIVFPMESPYVMCGATVDARFSLGGAGDRCGIQVSADGDSWKDVWSTSGAGEFSCAATLDDSLGIITETAVYRYYVRISLASTKGSAKLTGLKLGSVLLASPIALPRLSLGNNLVRYTDSSTGPRSVRVTHTYRESGNITPPSAPVLSSPADGIVSRDNWIEFLWSGIPDSDTYRLRVSTRPDILTSYRPCFDVIISDTALCNRRTGLFADGVTYYWSVRARNKQGVWGNWSPVRSFSWRGPYPPIELKHEERNGKLYLSWKPNPKGTRPVRYEVYASDIKGFRPCKELHTVFSLGDMPSNLAAVTVKTECLIVSPDPEDNAPNKSSYRVIAVDDNGTPGGTSWPLELEHPYIFSSPPTVARAGEPYEYTVLTLKSLGDIQYRYQKPNIAYWEREGYEFYPDEAPGWLGIDRETGRITGTPDSDDAGKCRVTVRVVRTWPYELKENDHRPEPFRKDGPEYRASAVQTFLLDVVK